MKETVKEYGGGLFELAVDEGLEEELLSQTRLLREVFDTSYLHLLTTPTVPKCERIGLVAEALDGRVHPYLASFVKLMTERGAAYELCDCFDEYERRYLQKHGILRATAESAVPLTDRQKAQLTSRLESRTGKKIEMTYRVLPALIGGVRLSFDNRLVDDTVRSALSEIASSLSSAVL